MKLNDFKENDVIYRKIPHEKMLRSFMSPIIFLKLEKDILFYKYFKQPGLTGIYYENISEWWDDDNWELFPLETYEKLKETDKNKEEVIHGPNTKDI